MKKPLKKLVLHRETLRVLGQQELAVIAGGYEYETQGCTGSEKCTPYLTVRCTYNTLYC